MMPVSGGVGFSGRWFPEISQTILLLITSSFGRISMHFYIINDFQDCVQD
jgi:hypothetical protein